MSTILPLYSLKYSHNTQKRPFSALIAAACSMSAFIIILMGMSNPAKIMNILSSPAKGFSSTVITQIIMAAAGIILFMKLKGKNAALSAVIIIICIFAAYGMSKYYMISTRPALNTPVLFALLFLLTVQTAALLNTPKNRQPNIVMPVSALAYSVCFLIFVWRISGLVPADRVLEFSNMLTGRLAGLFWGALILSALIPLIYSLTAYLKKNCKYSTFVAFISAAGMFVLCILINQMPLVESSINNRFFM